MDPHQTTARARRPPATTHDGTAAPPPPPAATTTTTTTTTPAAEAAATPGATGGGYGLQTRGGNVGSGVSRAAVAAGVGGNNGGGGLATAVGGEKRQRVVVDGGGVSGHAAPWESLDERQRASAPVPVETHALTLHKDVPVMVVLFLGAVALRFWKIWHPDQVVFDEVHFGKFAAYYIRREYYFDVHPPLAKLINALSAWLAGFDGGFEFENIGDRYREKGVPYVGMRALPALMGSAQVPAVYAMMRETGHSPIAAAFSAALLLFDNAHIAQDRLILLDASLVLFVCLSLFSYIKFYKYRYNEFTFWWWAWMVATGVFLAMTMSCKMVGLFTFMTVGTAVAIDLWNLLDIRRGLSTQHVMRHFWARTVGLIIIPALVYMFWFWVHFAILSRSGTGDSFMSTQFQQTLDGNPMLDSAREIHWNDKLTIKHRGTEVFLHSHTERYPLKYDDGRISSNGQQVTGYPHNDTNNVWQIVRPKPLEPSDTMYDEEPGMQRVVRHSDQVRLLHVNTNTYLMAHDVASPLMPTNEEFTTWPPDDNTRFNDTLFELSLDGQGAGSRAAFKSKATWFRLIHSATRVSLWTHADPPLPEWGFNQQEVNGNKNALEKTALWLVDELFPDETADDYTERIKPLPPRKKSHMPFIKKFFELQLTMLQQNNHLTQSHPYASSPINWPFALQGISFWTDDPAQKQIYMVGNLVSWWIPILSVSVLLGVLGANTVARRRGFYPIPPAVEARLYNSTGFFAVAWACHYFPFFLMQRQLFIHHYLPAHVASVLVAGSVFNFVTTETINSPVSVPGPLLSPRRYRRVAFNAAPPAVRALAGLVVAASVGMFYHLAPLTYGDAMTTAEVQARKWLQWTLHFAK